MSITGAIQKAHANDGIITPDEFESIYQEVIVEKKSRENQIDFLTQEKFRELMEGRFENSVSQKAFYKGLIQKYRDMKLNELKESILKLSMRDRKALLDNFLKKDGKIIGFRVTNPGGGSPDLSGMVDPLAIIFFPIVLLIYLLVATTSTEGTDSPLGEVIDKVFQTGRFFVLLGQDGCITDIQIIDGIYFTEDELKRGKMTLPSETRINFTELYKLIASSVENQFQAGSGNIQMMPTLGVGILNVPNAPRVSTTANIVYGGVDLTLSEQPTLFIDEQGQVNVSFALLAGYRYSSILNSLPNENTVSQNYHAIRIGAGLKLTSQEFKDDFPTLIQNYGLILSVLPRKEPSVIFSPEATFSIGSGGPLNFDIGAGLDLSPTFGLGAHVNLGLGIFLK